MRSPNARVTSAIRHPKSEIRNRAGFTLVELLVVIAIIGVLTALISVVAAAAWRQAKEAAVKVEVDGLSAGFKAYKEKYGEYPPNFNDLDAVKRHLRKAFPRITSNELKFVDALNTAGYVPRPDEAVFFWLGGMSSDPQHPLTGPGGPFFAGPNAEAAKFANGLFDFSKRNSLFDFDLTRLGPAEEDVTNGVVKFTGRQKFLQPHPDNPQRLVFIALPVYTPTGTDEARAEPYVYFDTSRTKPSPTDDETLLYVPGDGSRGVAVPHRRAGGGGLEYVNPESFQVLSAGLDDRWSIGVPAGTSSVPAANIATFPNGPFINEMADNLTNFNTGSLEDSQP
ncbi:MAG: type II secretion system protein [Planctomycetales bacterium]|nr:type II secretion system protein [Planctomycetales bacterium]